MEIPLKGSSCLIIDSKFALQFQAAKWYPWKRRSTVYARATVSIKGKKMRITAHAYAWYLTHGSLPKLIDHENGNGLDCRASNIRDATYQQNNQNRKPLRAYGGKRTTSKYKGVRKMPNGSFQARIQLNGKSVCLGTRAAEAEAAVLYNSAAREHFGEFAVLNRLPNYLPR